MLSRIESSSRLMMQSRAKPCMLAHRHILAWSAEALRWKNDEKEGIAGTFLGFLLSSLLAEWLMMPFD